MSELNTLRERIERASRFFKHIDAVVLTTFNLKAEFLEDHALPAILGVDATTTAGRQAELHHRLGSSSCTVFYDPMTKPKLKGRYRYVARPVPIRGHFFHPKLVILTGKSEHSTTWVYLAVSSANLTSSGWARNAESFGETWIHTRRQQPWQVLIDLLDWLSSYCPLGEEQDGSDAVFRIRNALREMPDRRLFNNDPNQPWSGALHAKLYASVVHKKGLQDFLQDKRVQRPSELWLYSPYWSDVSEQIVAFDSHRTTLIPALRRDGLVSLSKEQVDELSNLGEMVDIRFNEKDVGDRFWHMKAYWIRWGQRVNTAVGSCNFTRAGLAGKDGNVEAMLVFDDEGEWLPYGDDMTKGSFSEDTKEEEDMPEPTPVAIIVAWDWRSHYWRWWLEDNHRLQNPRLVLPGLEPFPIKPGTTTKKGSPPKRGALFQLSYRLKQKDATWSGLIVELNLDYSTRTYGIPLTPEEILESWRGKRSLPQSDIDNEEPKTPNGNGALERSTQEVFDVGNLFDFYRSIGMLRRTLKNLEHNPNDQHAYFVGRPDSVMALAQQAAQTDNPRVACFLVLHELQRVVEEWEGNLEEEFVDRIRKMTKAVRRRTAIRLKEELGGNQRLANRMVRWFEKELDYLG